MFTVNADDEIIYGLGAIKGLGEGPIESILSTREADGPFTDLFDFCARTDPRKVNRKAIEALIRSGALDSLGESRWVLMASMEDALKAAEQSASNRDAGIDDLFGEVVPSQNNGHDDVYAPFRNVRPWSDKERLGGERDTLGLYITGHPIDEYKAEIRKFAPKRIVDVRPDKQGNQVLVGLIMATRTMNTQRGTMAVLTLDDSSAQIEVTLFSEAYSQFRELLVKDTIVIVEGRVQQDDRSGKPVVRAGSVRSIDEARQNYASRLTLEVNAEKIDERFSARLQQILSGAGGGRCPVSIDYLQEHNKARVHLSERWRVVPSDDLIQALRDELGHERVALEY